MKHVCSLSALFAVLLLAAACAPSVSAESCAPDGADGRADLGLAVEPQGGPDDRALDIVQYRPGESAGESCRRVLVDRLEWEGGPPHVKDGFRLIVDGAPHVFLIAYWEIRHRGLGIEGDLYSLRVYREDETGALSLDRRIMDHAAIGRGFVGRQEDGEEVDYEGADRAGVVALLMRHGVIAGAQ